MTPFTCPRTCPLFGDKTCRFQTVFDHLGPAQVMSHTVKIKVAFTDPAALQSGVESMGGTWLGMGTHSLYSGDRGGYGFTLPGWNYPLVLDWPALSELKAGKGELFYDDYGGKWGNVADLEKLTSAYAVGVAEQAAIAQGWQCEHNEEGLVIYHPSGGTLTVRGTGVMDAAGFAGKGCHEAIEQLGLPFDVLGVKPEYGQVKAEVQLSEEGGES